MTTDELKKITIQWKLSDKDTIADPVKLKEAFETTQADIASFWSEVDSLKKGEKSNADQIRTIVDLLRNCIQPLPIYSFKVDGTFDAVGGGVDNTWGTVCGTDYYGPANSLGCQLIKDIDEKVWQYYFNRLKSTADFLALRDFCFPVGCHFWESKEKTNEINSRIPEFLAGADAETLMKMGDFSGPDGVESFVGRYYVEEYRLSEELPEVYSALIDRFIDVVDVDQLSGFLMDIKWRSEHGYSQLQALNDDQFTRLVEKAESADPQTVQALRTDLARGNDVVRAQDAGPDVGLDELIGFTLEA
jgi:hypothetical protein